MSIVDGAQKTRGATSGFTILVFSFRLLITNCLLSDDKCAITVLRRATIGTQK